MLLLGGLTSLPVLAVVGFLMLASRCLGASEDDGEAADDDGQDPKEFSLRQRCRWPLKACVVAISPEAQANMLISSAAYA